MAAYQLLINGIERPVRRGTLRLLRRINTRPVLDLEVQSIDASYIPGEGDAITLLENGIPIYGGRIEHATTTGIQGAPITAIATRIDCVDQMQLAEEVYVHSAFFGGTLKTFLQWVIADYLGAKGVTLDPAQVDGPELPARTYTYRSNKHMADVLTDYCALAVGYTWTISAGKVLSAQPPVLAPAPFHAAEGDRRVIGDVQREKSAELYANRVIVLGNTSLLLYYKDVFTSFTDGVRTVFPLTLLPTGPPPHLPNAGVVWIVANAGYEVAETFGLGSATWIYDPVANTITDTGILYDPNTGIGTPGGVQAYRSFPLYAGQAMWIIYDGTPQAFAVAENVPAQAAPRGVVERIVPSELSDVPSLQIIADAELARAIHRPLTITYQTDELGFIPGQWQHLNYPSRGVPNIPYTVQQIETADIWAQNPDATPRLRHTITAMEYIAGTTAYPDQIGDLYKLWSTDRGGSIGAAPAVESGGSGAVPVTESQIILADVTTNDVNTIRHGFAPKAPGNWQAFLNGEAGLWTNVTDNHLVLIDQNVPATNDVNTIRHGFAPKAPGDWRAFLNGTAGEWIYVTDAHLFLQDTPTNDVSIARHGFAPKAPGDWRAFLNGSAGEWIYVTDAHLFLQDTPTNDVSIARHGFAPKAPNLSNAFLCGGDPPNWQYVADAHLYLQDTPANDVTTARHGFAPKLPGTITTFFRGDGTYAPVPALAPLAHATSHQPGGADPLAVDAGAAVGSLRTLGTGPQQAAAGNDARLTGPRTPTAHATSHQPGGADAMAVDTPPTIGSLRTLGTGPQQAAAGNDARLTGPRIPTAHAPTHAAAGADALAVTALAGFPGGTTNFLRADGAFAVPSGVSPTDLEYRGGYVPGTYRDGDIVIGADGIAYLCVKAGVTTPPEPWPLATAPPLHHATHEPGGSDPLANAAWINQANVFTQKQSLQGTGFLSWGRAGLPADGGRWHELGGAPGDGSYQLYPVNDAENAVQNPGLVLTRAGRLNVAGDLGEKGRTLAVGHWIDVPFTAADFGATGGGTWTVNAAAVAINRYGVIGKTLHWYVYLAWFQGISTIAGTVTALTIRIPGGFTGPAFQMNPIAFSPYGALYASSSGGATIELHRIDGANFTAGAFGFVSMLTWEIN